LLFFICVCRALYSLHARRTSGVPRSLVGQPKPFMAFTGSGLLMAYYHGVATYVRDHFLLDDLQLSGISGGCSTILALAMGLDLYQILLVGLHMQNWIVKHGVYLNKIDVVKAHMRKLFETAGITDRDCAKLAAQHRCYIGVTRCFPPGHQCTPVPPDLDTLMDVWMASMCVVPFFRSPATVRSRYSIDGGFSAAWSIPQGQPWSDVIRVTCVPWWASLGPPAMATAVIQPSSLKLASMFVLFPWPEQAKLVKLGYDDARTAHPQLVARGMRPHPEAPLTEWKAWEELFANIDENNLPLPSSTRVTAHSSELEKSHDERLRTYSCSDLKDVLQGPRARRLQSGGSQSETNLSGLAFQ